MSATATIETDGSAILNLDGKDHKIPATNVVTTRLRIRELVTEHAARTGEPQTLVAHDESGSWDVVIHPDGRTETVNPFEVPEPAHGPSTPEGAVVPALAPLPSRREARSFLVPNEAPEEPPQQGFRALLSRAGIKIKPSAAETSERQDKMHVSQHWPGLRVVTVANGKGGSGKTPAVVNLASMFARLGGAGVLAADVNPFRGTLGWRTQQGPHEATIKDLLADINHVLGPGALLAEMSKYVHHQTADKFDVLRSRPHLLASAQRLSPEDMDNLIAVAGKYYRMLFLDTGNDESDPLFERIIARTDQLVVATSTRKDRAEGGILLLDSLRDQDERSARLAREAVVVISVADKSATHADIREITEGFAPLCRKVVTIPHDEAMIDGWLKHDALAPATRRACLAAAAAVAQGF